MLAQNAGQLLPIKRKLPGENASSHGWQRKQRRAPEIDVGSGRQR
jgi:hypothetical protein